MGAMKEKWYHKFYLIMPSQRKWLDLYRWNFAKGKMTDEEAEQARKDIHEREY